MRHGPVTKSFSATAPSPATPRTAPPPSSNSPLPSYRSHYDVIEPKIDGDAYRPCWLVKSHLWALAENGKITPEELAAATAWRKWNEELGKQRVQRWDNLRIDHSPVLDAVAAYQLTAACQLRASAEVLGPERVALLEWSVRDDWTRGRIGRRIGLSDKTAMLRIVEAIAALTLWRKGLPIPPPPGRRFRNQPRSW